ncbi:MAG: bis-aminopropyl spermidine synthase family protein [Candidatus Eremiobacteraeota bacterium]|nr:bis-aminopropyl spermidine synthase family protein [Candidatus Eremiobacteraeota bacterium]MCW5868115.1 bis-aminopropyl spermidine synthase family protein [Candidatus Eremiobacteraeota bacterium]
MSAKQLSELIGQLLGEKPSVPYLPKEFRQRIETLLQRFQSRDRLQSFYMHYSLRMTEATYQRLHQPAPGPDEQILEQFLARLQPYPEASQEFAQGSVDPASSLRRAETVHRHLQGRGRVLALGDDDATGLALSLLGDYQIQVIDIDERIIAWLAAMGLPGEVHDLRELPDSYSGAYDAVITDPPRDLELAGEFLQAALRCLAPGGLLFWADHPDWNQAALTLLERAQRQGLELLEEHSNWHCYVPHVISDATAHHFRIPPGWFHELVKYARLWSHLYVLRDTRAGGISRRRASHDE